MTKLKHKTREALLKLRIPINKLNVSFRFDQFEEEDSIQRLIDFLESCKNSKDIEMCFLCNEFYDLSVLNIKFNFPLTEEEAEIEIKKEIDKTKKTLKKLEKKILSLEEKGKTNTFTYKNLKRDILNLINKLS